MEDKKILSPHSLMLENRQGGRITGVKDVKSFDEKEILLFTQAGKLVIKGEQLHVKQLYLRDSPLPLYQTKRNQSLNDRYCSPADIRSIPVRYPVSRPQTNSFCYFFIFAILQDSKNHHHETNNRNHRSYHDTAGAEYIGIERIIPGTSTTHQYETKHDAGNRYRNQYKILFSESKISFSHLSQLFIIRTLNIIQLIDPHPQIFIHGKNGRDHGQDNT